MKPQPQNSIAAAGNFLLKCGIDYSNRYFDVRKLVSKRFNNYIILSKKGIGKTYSMIRFGLDNYLKTGERFAFIRRSKTERDGFVKGVLKPLLPERNMYYGNGTVFEYADPNEANVRNPNNKIVGHILSLSTANSTASTIEHGVSLIFFDEFVSKSFYYLAHEIQIFLELIKTLERDQKDVKIILCSNANDHNNPYIVFWDIPKDWWLYTNSNLREKILYLRIPGTFFIATDNPKYTSQSWVKRDDEMDAFLNHAYFLRSDDVIKTKRELAEYEIEHLYYLRLNDITYDVGEIQLKNEFKYIVREHHKPVLDNAELYNLTAKDNFKTMGQFPHDATSFFKGWWNWLNNKMVWFSSYEARDLFFTYIPRLFYNYPQVEREWK